MKKYSTVDETKAYVTAESSTNTDERNLIGGSKNMLIDEQRKVRTRNGNTRLGAADSDIANKVQNGGTWNTSTGTEIVFKFKAGVMSAYLRTVDGVAINAFKDIASVFSATGKPRFTSVYDDNEVLDLLAIVDGTDNLFT